MHYRIRIRILLNPCSYVSSVENLRYLTVDVDVYYAVAFICSCLRAVNPGHRDSELRCRGLHL